MVQVDVFWSYAIGAGFAACAGHRLAAARPKVPTFFGDASGDPGVVQSLLFLSILFAPSGAWLLWGFTSWETMHVADDVPAWLTALFAATNVTQGLLGYLVARWLIWKRRPYAAFVQFVAGYFAMFFVLVHGWDGTGYMRFFSPTRGDIADWTWSTAGRWLSSDVAMTLYGMGVVLLPFMFLIMVRELRAGAKRSPTVCVIAILAAVYIGGLGSAVLASVAIHLLGWWLGATAAAVAIGVLGLREGGYIHRLYGIVCR